MKNAIGKESFEDFKQLNKDLFSQENTLKLLKSKGVNIDDLSKAARSYIVKPGIAKAQFGIDFVTKLYRRALANPKMTKDWKNALKDLRKGKVKEAIASLTSLGKSTENDLPTSSK